MEEHGGGGRACLLYSCYFFNNKKGGETASVSTGGRGGDAGWSVTWIRSAAAPTGMEWSRDRETPDSKAETDGRDGELNTPHSPWKFSVGE